MHGVSDTAVREISVVIATLGGESLKSTIEHLNAGSLVPTEILLAIPAAEAHKVRDLVYPNVRVLPTNVKGQVPQRAAGFAQASHELVMQLDDDIVVDRACLAALVREMSLHGPRCALAPSLRWFGSGRAVYAPITPSALSKVFYWLLNGRPGCRPGSVTRAGAEIGVYPARGERGAVDAEWLPGGCVLHHRSNLVLENYYPFPGKAYCEDLIHCLHLRNRGVRLLVSRDAVAYLGEPPPMSFRAFVKELVGDFRARRYYVELTSRSMLRMYLFFFARIVRRVVD